ncbi:MAG: hypothetical protein EI684_19615 [Candidatus Viridilinea halotolerans]|uniref:NB-ARC domain-containing protein n=1 Tax=Candidatus Viridilinea halotolerans TaxID=2491704 RepID=A0A426TSM0_9CHLR|nr:MAG: hypothetical protein EI684_19615 [Candidatus Viridilinea halotolerans]
MSSRNETFGRLLKIAINSIATYEGKTAPIIEEELAEQVGLAGSALQRYKSGYLPPEPRTIEVIAEASIRRGLFSREWLERFLHAARYPQTERLVEQLCPLGPARPRPPRVYENLPAPTYSQFVMREQAFAEVLDGLQQRSAAVLIVGMGGNGKTSLAREVAAACLHDAATHPRCDALVWVSDKDRPGTTNLSVVLDTIARTLDYPGFTQFAHSEKQHEVEQLLRRQRVLLVVDNFETINDSALLTWLLRLPEPSKALITTREYRREWRSSWPIELRGMSEAEAWTLVEQRLRQLRIEQLVSARQQLDPLLMATSGNPKAITMTLGLIKYERRPLQEVVDDLYAARGELFDDLFARAWALLDEAARRILLVATFFPTSASADALSASADAHGFAFDRAIERLVDLALLDVYQSDLGSPVRYALHPLVRAFAAGHSTSQSEFTVSARRRWVDWHAKLIDGLRHSWQDLKKLQMLDADHDSLFTAIDWAIANHATSQAIEMTINIYFYLYIRGFWNQGILLLHAANVAHAFNDLENEITLLAYYTRILCQQNNLKEAARYLSRLEQLQQTVQDRIIEERLKYTQALFLMRSKNLRQAAELWDRVVEMTTSEHRKVSSRQWQATCLFLDGQIDAAEDLMRTALQAARERNLERGIMYGIYKLGAISLIRHDTQQASSLLEESLMRARELGDRRNIGNTLVLYAKLHGLRNNPAAAQAALSEALDLFERMGMSLELAEAREALRELQDHALKQ